MILTINEHGDPIHLGGVVRVKDKNGTLIAYNTDGQHIGAFRNWYSWTLSPEDTQEQDDRDLEDRIAKLTARTNQPTPPHPVAMDQVEQLYTDLCTRVQNIVELRATNEQSTDQSDEYYRGITNGLEVARATLLEDNVNLVPKKTKLYQGDTLMPFEDMPNPTEDDLTDPFFNATFELMKTWDINVPQYYAGYCSGNGSHVKLLMNALQAAEDEQTAREDAEYAERRAEEERQSYEDEMELQAQLNAEIEKGQQAELGCSGCGKAMSRCICPQAMLEEEETPYVPPVKQPRKKGRNYDHTNPNCPFYFYGNDNVDSMCRCDKEGGEALLPDC